MFDRSSILAGVFLLVASSAFGVPVQLDSGAVEGVAVEADPAVQVFRGIPYAAPPVGELRWKAPAPVSAWEGVRSATEFSGACPQGPGLAQMMGVPLPDPSEDCLYLNVWSTAVGKDAKLPVMVWIHGGGLSLGWGHQALYDGVQFAQKDVVLVSINYRLGALGFLADSRLTEESGVSGNYGLMDQIAALEWVQRNIAAFGGDPGNVTIFGESAGGTSVYALLATPRSKGLFHRAISQSAWVTDGNFVALSDDDGDSAEGRGEAWLAQHFAEADSLAELRAIEPDALVAAQDQGFNLAVTIDGDFMPEHPQAIFESGKQMNVPLVAGSNTDEGTMFVGALPFETVDAYKAAITGMFPAHAETILELYPAANDAALFQVKNQIIADTWFAQATRNMLAAWSQVPSPAFQYHFSRRSTAMPMMGAAHAAEIKYAFSNLTPPESGQEADQALADAMIRYWVQFATSGNPNAEGLPEWPAYEAETDLHLELGDEVKAGEGFRKAAVDTLNSIRAAMAQPAEE